MKITHVLRGVEWQPSTAKHILLYKLVVELRLSILKIIGVFTVAALGASELLLQSSNGAGLPSFKVEWLQLLILK